MSFPACANCLHAGIDHDWRNSRTRGCCLLCPCRHYKPNVNRKPPASALISKPLRNIPIRQKDPRSLRERAEQEFKDDIGQL